MRQNRKYKIINPSFSIINNVTATQETSAEIIKITR